MSVVVLLEIQVKPEALDEMKAFLKKNLPDTCAYDGCQGLLVKRGQLTRPAFGVSRTFGVSRPGSLPMAEIPRCPQVQSLALGMCPLLLQS